MPDIIRFTALIPKITTMADGGYRVVLDLPETALDAVSELMQAKQAGAVLEVAAVPIEKPKAWREDQS